MILKVKNGKMSESIYGTGYVWMLEKQFESYLHKKHHCISVSNATLGIWAALNALGINQEDKILVTPFSFGGTIAGVINKNPTIVFGNFDAKFLSLDPDSVNHLLKKYTEIKAVIDVDFLGLPSRSKEIAAICREHNVMYILDCANSFGTINSGYASGYYADIAIYSLNSQKNLKAGEGGLICTRHKIIYDKIMINHLHPDRQRKEYPTSKAYNQFSLNIRIHPLAAFIACKNFNIVLQRIKLRQRDVFKKLPFLRSYFGSNVPNFNNILLNQCELNSSLDSLNLDYSPFNIDKYYLPDEVRLFSTTEKVISHIDQHNIQKLKIIHIV
jgi:perosamine synthetase